MFNTSAEVGVCAVGMVSVNGDPNMLDKMEYSKFVALDPNP